MATQFYISSRVIDTLHSLPAEDRLAIANVLVGEMFLGEDGASASLTPIQSLAYTIIRSYVQNDTLRAARVG